VVGVDDRDLLRLVEADAEAGLDRKTFFGAIESGVRRSWMKSDVQEELLIEYEEVNMDLL